MFYQNLNALPCTSQLFGFSEQLTRYLNFLTKYISLKDIVHNKQ